ncbi:MAG: MFS transporter [Chloroflexota bacterium]
MIIKKKKIFYGWWIVLASSILNFVSGGTFAYGFTVFFNPIRQAFGWSAAVTSFAASFRGLETGFLDPVVGYLVDKIGPRKLMLCGWGVVGLGFLLLSRINSLWQFYGAFLIVATGMCFGSFVVVVTAIAHWFHKKRSRALALIYVGMGASGIIAPLLALSINQFGWRTSLVIIGIASLVIGIPLSALMRHKPGQYGYLPDGETRETMPEPATVPQPTTSSESEHVSSSSAIDFTAKEAMKTRTFWLFSLVFLFQHTATSAVMIHIVPYLESVNVPSAIAATAVTGMTLCSLIGRLGFGFLGDFANKRYLIAIALAVQTLGLFIFSLADVSKPWLIVLFLLTYGPGFAGTIPLRPALQADYFGIRSFGTIMGWMALISMFGGLVSPVFAGWVYDTTGSYRLVWQLFALTTIPAIPLILLAKPPRAKQ